MLCENSSCNTYDLLYAFRYTYTFHASVVYRYNFLAKNALRSLYYTLFQCVIFDAVFLHISFIDIILLNPYWKYKYTYFSTRIHVCLYYEYFIFVDYTHAYYSPRCIWSISIIFLLCSWYKAFFWNYFYIIFI